MQCPYCGCDKLKVLDTTDIKNGIRRRRECTACGERFTTYERAVAVMPMLVKSNGDREEFDRDKLKRGIWNACAKRPIPAAEIDRLAANIETALQALGKPEVSSRFVGDMVIKGLKELDPIAYIRYAIVYLGLDNLLSVRAEIDKLLAEQQGYDGGPSAGIPASSSDTAVREDTQSETAAEPARTQKRPRRSRHAAEASAAAGRSSGL